MNLYWFFKYLTFARWSRFLGFVFAFLFCFITAFYFFEVQSNHRQTVWHFKNVRTIHEEEIELEPYVYYKIRWDNESYPYYIIIDEKNVCAGNLYYHCKTCWNHCGDYINFTLSNPFRIQFTRRTKLGMSFNAVRDASGDILSFPFTTTNWSIEETNQEDKEGEFVKGWIFDNPKK